MQEQATDERLEQTCADAARLTMKPRTRKGFAAAWAGKDGPRPL